MTAYRILTALGLAAILGVPATSSATEPSPIAEKEAREKFVKLLLPEGPPKETTSSNYVAVNAFAAPPATPVRPQRPGNRPLN